MTKMQPLFSFQKYQADPEDAQEQFQKQLGDAYIQSSNAVNATIDDMSYFNKIRPTGETWINGKQIFTVTVTPLNMPDDNTAPTAHGIPKIVTLVSYSGQLVPPTWPASGIAMVLPYPASSAGSGTTNNIEVSVDQTNIYLTSAGNFTGYTGSLTIWYTNS